MFPRCRTICPFSISKKIPARSASTATRETIRQKRSEMFAEEQKRQHERKGRIESISVKYKSYSEDINLCMKKNISTPLDCARHVSGGLTKLAAVALVNEQVWDVHKPLQGDCTVSIVTPLNPEIPMANNAFWRTCSLLLGSVGETAFKEDVEVHPHSFPQPIVKSGSFIHDIFLNLPTWQPTSSELRALSAEFVKLATQGIELERLEASEEFALKLFEDNPYKLAQIPDIAKSNDNKIVMYKVRDYVDISKGPMIANTYAIGRATIAAVHKSPLEESSNLYRFQGIALPKGIRLNHFAYGILETRAKHLNETVWMPRSISQPSDSEPRVEAAAASN